MRPTALVYSKSIKPRIFGGRDFRLKLRWNCSDGSASSRCNTSILRRSDTRRRRWRKTPLTCLSFFSHLASSHHFTTKVPLRPQTVRTLAIVAAAVVVLWVILGASGVMLRMMISVWG